MNARPAARLILCADVRRSSKLAGETARRKDGAARETLSAAPILRIRLPLVRRLQQAD